MVHVDKQDIVLCAQHQQFYIEQGAVTEIETVTIERFHLLIDSHLLLFCRYGCQLDYLHRPGIRISDHLQGFIIHHLHSGTQHRMTLYDGLQRLLQGPHIDAA